MLNLMWFWAALRATLAECGRDGWGAAATASSAAFGAVFFLLISVSAALAFSIAGAGNPALVSALNDFVWASAVLSSFPRAMMVMSAAFGLWRAGLISNPLFAVGVAIVVLGVLGGTTWAERRILGAGRRLCAIRLAPARARVDRSRDPGPFEPPCDGS